LRGRKLNPKTLRETKIEQHIQAGGAVSVVMNDASTLRGNVAVAANLREPDAALVEAARRHDPDAFEEIVTRYGARIFDSRKT